VRKGCLNNGCIQTQRESETAMKIDSRTVVKNVIVAVTLGLAGVASWAVTQMHTPTLEAQVTLTQAG
jgi:hypothetical protein